MSSNMARELLLFVNGRKVTDSNVDPEHTLLHYLRELGYTGTKLGCGEGGCGACTVMVSSYNKVLDKIVHKTVNACLMPVCAVDGMAVTTIEGIGNAKRMHPVQERLAKSHGSQCGFCTPGIIMSMYTLLRNNPEPTMKEIEDSFDGNLCRCTGYRPILDGFHTFAKDGTEYIKAKEASGGCCGGGEGGGCPCKDPTNIGDTIKHELFNPAGFTPLNSTQELIFPPELIRKAKESKSPRGLHVVGPRVTWIRPTSLKELISLRKKNPEAKLVVGNTEIGFEVKFKNARFPMLLHVSDIPELTNIEETKEGISFGSSTTLTDIEAYIHAAYERHPEYKLRNLAAMKEMLKWFAGNQIRNVACVAGNIATASPISDLNPVFVASGSTLKVKSCSNGKIRTLKMQEFFLGYRKTQLKPEEVLLSITVPFTHENEYVEAYKQARRRDDDIAIVNACFRVHLDPIEDGHVVKDVAFAYGGMGPTTLQAKKTVEGLKGKKWDESIPEFVRPLLEEDMPLSWDAPGGLVEYRRSLTTGFFFKYFVTVQQQLNVGNLDPKDASASLRYERPVSKSVQTYEAPLVGAGGEDPIGKPLAHLAAAKQSTGEALYTDDLPAIKNELRASLVYSTVANGKIMGVDTKAAREMPGVEGIFTHSDVPGTNTVGPIFKDEEVFASKRVCHIGQPIAIVVADTHAHAKEAAAAVKVVYEAETPVLSIDQAIAAKSYHMPAKTMTQGDPAEAMKTADHIFEGTLHVGGQEHFYLETNACLCVPGEGGEMEIFASTQNPMKTQMTAAEVLGVPANRVVCRVKRMGGGFGGKETRTLFVSNALAVAAHHLGKPVRCMLERDEDMSSTGGRHPFQADYKVGVMSDGKVVALEIDLYCNAGYSVDLSGAVLDRALFSMDNCYNIPNMRATGHLCKTHLASNTAFRGFGGPQGMMFAEAWISQVAEICGISQNAAREINFYKEGDRTHFSQELTACQLGRVWDEVLQTSKYNTRQSEVAEYNSQNRWRKRGIAVIPTKYGISFTATFLNQAGALVHIYTDGTVMVTHGGTEMGQGLHTKMCMVASRALGVHIDKVHIMETSTNTVPNSSPTAASASSDLYGMAVLNACQILRERLAPFKAANPDGDFKAWVNAAYFDRVCLSANGFYKTPNLGYDWETNKGRPFNYFCYGAACSEVEIDVLTGDVQVLRSDIVMDVGASLNPAIDIGQVEGGFIQGYGLFALEELVYSPNGLLYSRGPSMYKIPGFKDIPLEMNVSLLRNAPNVSAIHSSKAVGEPPLFLGSSVYFAIREAIKSARADNNVPTDKPFRLDTPATPHRVRLACEDKFTAQFPSPEEPVKRWNIVV